MKGMRAFVLGVAIGILLLYATGWRHIPACPAEDSCYPDYYSGEWHIVKGERP